MRDLRARLQAVASSKPETPKTDEKREAFFLREHIVPIDELCGVEYTTLHEICACDPLFSGQSWDIRRILFLDTETTGLSGGTGTVAFEIGIGWIEARGMIIRQYIMRDYGEEAAMLCEIAKLFERFDTVVSFNGKSFDLPLLESRMIMNRIRLPLTQMPHFDLFHAARRVYKLRLKRCNLASLEEAVLGQHREGDLPGALVPQRYFDYIKTREFMLLEDVLKHNYEDVKSLACLVGHLCSVFRTPELLLHPEDMLGVGKTLLRSGETQKARKCFRLLKKSTLSSQAHVYLSASYKKEKEWEQAVETWREMTASGVGGVYPYIELAKYYEHVKRDAVQALRCTNAALTHALNTAPIDAVDERQMEAIYIRIRRLQKKCRSSELHAIRRI